MNQKGNQLDQPTESAGVAVLGTALLPPTVSLRVEYVS